MLIKYKIYDNNFKYIKIVQKTLFIIHFISFFLTVISNPGMPDRKYYYNKYIQIIAKEDKSKYKECKICNIITPKEMNVSHCNNCDICIVNKDHHCICMGKCIGRSNCFLFYFSMSTIPFYTVMCFLTLLGHFIYLKDKERQINQFGEYKY